MELTPPLKIYLYSHLLFAPPVIVNQSSVILFRILILA
jgi:hypothetical protein